MGFTGELGWFDRPQMREVHTLVEHERRQLRIADAVHQEVAVIAGLELIGRRMEAEKKVRDLAAAKRRHENWELTKGCLLVTVGASALAAVAFFLW